MAIALRPRLPGLLHTTQNPPLAWDVAYGCKQPCGLFGNPIVDTPCWLQFEDYKSVLSGIVHGDRRLEGCSFQPTSSMESFDEGSSPCGTFVTLRMRLKCEIFRDGLPVDGNCFEVCHRDSQSRFHYSISWLGGRRLSWVGRDC